MSQQIVTTGIVLGRTDYGEADRILTVLTPDRGKLRLMAKGVRRIKSKLAGGVELFSVSDITYIPGRGEIGTLISSRLQTHYGTIVKDIERTMLGYELIRQLNKTTEDQTDQEYFGLLKAALECLDDPSILRDVIQFWFAAQLLRFSGHTPNLQTDIKGTKLLAGQAYEFSFDDSTFFAREGAVFSTDHLKFLRLAFGGIGPHQLMQVQGTPKLVADCLPLTVAMQRLHLRI